MPTDVTTANPLPSGGARFTSCALAVVAGIFLGWPSLGRAAVPHIDLIEPFGTNQVLVHFYTDPLRQYVLQFSTNAHPVLVTNVSGTTTNIISTNRWFNLSTIPCSPFNGHHIIATGRTNSPRFYRLRVTNCN